MADQDKRHITACKLAKTPERVGGGPDTPDAPGGAGAASDGQPDDQARPDQLTLDEALDAQAEFFGRAIGALMSPARPQKPKVVATRSRPIRRGGKRRGAAAARFELLYFDADGQRQRLLYRVQDTTPGRARAYARRKGIPVGTDILVRCRRTGVGFWITVIPPIGGGK